MKTEQEIHEGLSQLARETRPPNPLATAGELWWRAEVIRRLISREKAVQEAERPLLWGKAVGLVLVEAMDLVFALDSIPAAFAITADPFLVFTSNVFAILGLRSLYFALAGAIEKFRYLKTSLSAILGLIGAKMLTGDLLKEQFGPNVNLYMLGIVVGILVAGAIASIIATRRENGNADLSAAEPSEKVAESLTIDEESYPNSSG